MSITRMNDNNHKAKFKVQIKKFGGSHYIGPLPDEIMAHIEATDNQDPVTLQTEYAEKHGHYISGWNPEQQEEDEEDQ